jgi:DNA-binding NarL/FixJ family response regulator
MVFLTIHDDPEFVQAAIGAGGIAYVLKACVGTDLVTAIHAGMELFFANVVEQAAQSPIPVSKRIHDPILS